MKDSTKILDRYDKKENIYRLILKFSEKGHKILSGGTASVSDDSLNVLDVVLENIESEKETDEYRETTEKDG
ncbi:MAG TPA: hypothetical protein PK303_00395 [bacterium]|nr:hypothetical protein [bacterium]HOL34676.1 hypothetical protein [bacterium]HPP07566.1 hypothetical protein [bacterium]